MKQKTGQISQIFVWIIVALVIGATALIGIRSISSLLDDKCSIDLIRFNEKIVEKIKLNNNYGSVNLAQIATPCDYTMVCFVDARVLAYNNAVIKKQDRGSCDIDNPQCGPGYVCEKKSPSNAEHVCKFNGAKVITPKDTDDVLGVYKKVIQNNVQSGSDNVFLFNQEIIRTVGYVDQVRLSKDSTPNNIFCVEAKAGRISLILNGLGKNTLISAEN